MPARFRVAGTLLTLSAVASVSPADTWFLPDRATFYSENGRFAVTIEPRKLRGQLEYFEDKVEGRPDAGADKRVRDNRPRAIFHTVGPGGRLRRVARFDLVNEVAPVTTLISNDGRYLVTFDNWHSRGYGDDVIVIYRTDGSLIRALSLEDVLTAEDIALLPRSISSIQWGGGHSIDEGRQLLVLGIEPCSRSGACAEERGKVSIRLADGTLLEPPRTLLPQPTVSLRSAVRPTPEETRVARIDPVDPPCASEAGFSDAPEVSFDRLRMAAADPALPAYTPIARKASVYGTVVLELLLVDGAVVCVKTLVALPMGLTQSAEDAARRWRFSPSPDLGAPVRTIVAVDFSLGGVRREPG